MGQPGANQRAPVRGPLGPGGSGTVGPSLSACSHRRGRVLLPVRGSLRFVDALDTIAWVLYGGFWLVVAIFSATMAASENEPRYLLLTSTASLNIFLYKVTGQTRSDLNRRAAAQPRRRSRTCSAARLRQVACGWACTSTIRI